MGFLSTLSHCVKSYGHFCQILALLTMPADQIWSCHVTQDPNFKNFYFVLIIHLISGKVTKFQNFQRESSPLQKLSAKNLTGVETLPPSAFRVKDDCRG